MNTPIESDGLLSAPTLWELLERRVAATPGATMLIDGASGGRLSFVEFRDQAIVYARWLRREGVTDQSVVAWQLPTRIETVLLCVALARLGAVQAPVIHLYRERELGEVIRQSRPHFIVTLPAQADLDYPARVAAAISASAPALAKALVIPQVWDFAAEELPPVPARRTAEELPVRWHYYTSGTTSRPKAAMHTDASLMVAGRGMAGVLGMSANDTGSIAYPFAHVGGIAYLCAALACGMAIVLFERYAPAEVAAAFRRYGVTYGGGSTAHYQALLNEQRRQPGIPLAPTLKVLAAGGASKPAALYRQVREELGCLAVHAYGLTEAPISTSNAPGDSDDQLMNSDGQPLNGMEIQIRRRDGSLAEPGESGEIVLRGPNVCRGYLDPAQTREAFGPDGFFHTGDLGVIRPDGRLRVTGRIKDVIIRKGENISALEIEELLHEHPKVRDVAVIGLPDEERGERVCAVVVPVDPREPLAFGEMQEYLVSRQLMRQKIPEQLEILAGLPRNEGLQKVVKFKLRRMLLSRASCPIQ